MINENDILAQQRGTDIMYSLLVKYKLVQDHRAISCSASSCNYE